MVKILIAGYHGFGNCGDEAILLAMSNNITKLDKDVSLTALSYKPEVTKEMYGINSVQRFNIKSVISAILKNDIIVSGGGSLLQDETSTRSLFYYLSIILFSKMSGKKVMLYSNGIGPVKKKFNRFMIRKIVNKVDLITLREKSSEAELRSIGVNKPPIYVTADPAFTLKGISKEKASQILANEKIPQDKPFLGISIRDWKNSGKFYEKLSEACADISQKYNLNILIVPMQYPTDLNISNSISERIKKHFYDNGLNNNESTKKSNVYILKGKYKSEEILGIIGLVYTMVSMRLHTLIFAGVQRVPMVGIVYDPKVSYYLNELKMPSVGDVTDSGVSVSKIKRTIEDTIINRERYIDTLEEIITRLTLKAKESDTHLKTLIKGDMYE